MKLSLNRFDSETVRASIEGYKQKFPLPDSQEYQDLLDRAYDALSQNEGFKKALLASGNAVLTHSIGRRKESETILTAREFCSRLTAIRQRLKDEQKKDLENAKNLDF